MPWTDSLGDILAYLGFLIYQTEIIIDVNLEGQHDEAEVRWRDVAG